MLQVNSHFTYVCLHNIFLKCKKTPVFSIWKDLENNNCMPLLSSCAAELFGQLSHFLLSTTDMKGIAVTSS